MADWLAQLPQKERSSTLRRCIMQEHPGSRCFLSVGILKTSTRTSADVTVALALFSARLGRPGYERD